MSKLIPLSRGLFATVDDADFDWLNQWKWSCHGHSPLFYAATKIKGKIVKMHRLLINPKDGMQIDHIDGDRINNQRLNLRACTQAENCRNTKKHTDNTSGFKGVHYNPKRKKWEANIRYQYRLKHLGRHICPLLAYVAYCRAGRKLFGDYFRAS